MADMARIVLTSDTRGLAKGEKAMTGFARKGEQTERRVKKSAAAMSGSMNALSASAVRMAAVAGAAIGAFLGGKLFLGAIREQEQLQRNMLKTQGIIEATGGAAGRTADQLHEQARALARVTLQSTEGIMAAQQVMLTFRHVTEDTFDRAIEAAADMSEAIGTDLKSSVLQLGKALEDPVTGMTALTRSGTVFTIEQKAMVKAMVEAGNAAGAQMFILGELEEQYGGVARAAGKGLGGVMDDLTQSWQEFRIALADTLSLGEKATSMLGGLSSTLDRAAGSMDSMVTGFKAAVVVVVALGATHIPMMILALRVATVGMSAAAIATGAFTAAVNLARFATIALGGPLGIVWGVIGAAGAAWIVFKDNTESATTEIYNAEAGAIALSEALGVFHETAAPSAAKAAIELANDNRTLAKSALDAAEAELALIEALNLAAEQRLREGGGVSAFGTNLGARQAAESLTKVIMARGVLDDARAALRRVATTVTGAASEEMTKLTVVVKDAEDALDAFGGAGEVIPEFGKWAEGAEDKVGGVKTAVETLADKMKTELISAVDGVANAFADWIGRGLRDFKSFAGSIISTFKTMLINMIAMAAKNKIMISLGLGGASVGGVASAASGGGAALLGGLGASVLGGLSGVGMGVSAGFAAGGIGGAISGGLASTGTIISGGLAAGGVAGIGAAIGAALPIIGIGLLLFSLFKKKPPYKEKDFNAIQAAIELTNMELLNTNTAGQKAATALKKAFGGLENMQRATEGYYNSFFTNEEKRLRAIEGIDGVFASLGIAVPTTAASFREIVEAQDLMTSEGRDTYAALLLVSDAFAQVYGGVNDVTDALLSLNASVGGSIFSTLVDERRAAAYARNGIEFDVAQPDRAGGGIAYRGTGPRITATSQADADKQAEILATQAEAHTSLLIDIYKNTKRTFQINDSWDVEGLPPERT